MTAKTIIHIKNISLLLLACLLIIIMQNCAGLGSGKYRIIREDYKDSHSNISVTKYYYDEQDRLIKKYYTDNHYNTKTRLWKYNKAGKLVKLVKDEPGKTETIVYEYNALGNVNKEIYTNTFGNKLIKTYEYDEKGHIIREVHQKSPWEKDIITREFNGDNKLIKQEHTNSRGKSYCITYSYNESGSLIKKEKTYWDDPKSDVTTYEYNKRDIITRIETRLKNGNTITINYIYHEKYRDKVKKIVKTNSVNYKAITRYLYDNKARVIEEEFTDTNDYYRKNIYEYTKYDKIKIRKYYEKYYYEIIFYKYENY